MFDKDNKFGFINNNENSNNINSSDIKKYIDDNTVIHPLPVYEISESPSMITYIVNIMDLKTLTTYGAIRDMNSTKYQRYRFVYICDDGKKKTIINTGDDINDTTFRVYHYGTSSTLTFNNKIYSINYTNHSTSTDVVVTESIQKYLGIYNTQEYTPTENYHPSTKKYVDDKIKNDLGDEELTTVNKDVKGAINEVNAQYKEITTLVKNIEEFKNALSSNKKHLTLNNGVYNVDSEIIVEDVTIIGKDDVVFKCVSNINNMLNFKGVVNIKGVIIDANNLSYSGFIDNSNSINIQDVTVKNCKSEYNNTYPTNNACELKSNYANIDGLKVIDNEGYGLALAPTIDDSIYKIINSEFSRNAIGYQGSGLVNRHRDSGSKLKSIIINNCAAFDNGASGLATHTCNNIIISNCECSNNGEHGICIMDGKNAVITGNKSNNNNAAGLRIQGDFSTSEDDISGWNNAQVTGNDFSQNDSGISVGFKVKNVFITGNNLTNENSYPVFVQYAENRTNCNNIIVTGNILSTNLTSARKNAPVCQYIVDDIVFDNYDTDGNRITYYTLLGSKGFIDTSKVIIGENINIIKSSKDYSSDWNMHGTLSDGVITSNTSGWYMYQRLNYSKERFISLILEFDKENMTETSPSIMLRFRNSDGGVVTETGYKYINFNGKITVIWDLLEDIDRTKLEQSSFIDITITGTANKTIKPVNIIGCYSNQLPICVNSI